MPSIRQRFHLSPCSDFRSHFWPTSLEAHRSHTSVSQLAHRSMRQTLRWPNLHSKVKEGPRMRVPGALGAAYRRLAMTYTTIPPAARTVAATTKMTIHVLPTAVSCGSSGAGPPVPA